MAKATELEARIEMLEDIEAIKKLKAKYWRCLDKKLWTEMEEVFAEDATVDYGPKQQFRGKHAIIQSFKDDIGRESVITFHGGHNPEIEITGDATAKAIWPLQDYVILEPHTKMMGWGHYEDEYVKEQGQWKKKSVNPSLPPVTR